MPSAPSAPHAARKPGPMIAVAAAAAFLATFNETFLNVALAPIMADFGIGVATAQWLATGYMLTAAVFVPVSGFFYRRFSTRALFAGVVGLMLLGSLIGALAPTFPILLGGRLLQAIGTGLLIPIGMNITVAASPREKLGLYMGIMGAMTTLGPSVSILVSGALLEVTTWRTLMWVFAALCAIVLFAGAAVLRTLITLGRPRLDVLSAALIAIGLVGLLYGVSTAFSGALAMAFVSMLVGIAAIVLFALRQLRASDPLLNLSPFANPRFTLGVLMVMATLTIVFAMNIAIPIFLQSAQGQSSLDAALTVAPAILLSAVVAPFAGRAFDRSGIRPLAATGFVLIGAFALLVAWAAGGSSLLLIAALYVPLIAGTALVVGPVQTFALSQLSREQSPHGVTVFGTGFQVAGCVGTAIATGVYGAVTAARASSGIAAADAAVTGFRSVGLLVAIIALAGVVMAFAAVRSAARASAAPVAPAAPASADGGAGALAPLIARDVFTLSPEQTVLEALQMFAARGISGAPIADRNGRLVGFLSDGDVMRYLAAEHSLARGMFTVAASTGGAPGASEDDELSVAMRDLMQLPVMRLGERRVITIPADASMTEAVAALADAHLKKVPVVDGKRMVGIVSRSAINRSAVAAYLEQKLPQLV